MKVSTLISRVSSLQKGTFHVVELVKTITTKDKELVEKHSTLQGQVRIEYSNIASVSQAIASGDRDAPEMPQWAERETIDNVVLWKHKKTGEFYFPFRILKSLGSEWLDANGTSVNPDCLNLYAKDNPTNKRKNETGFVILKVDNVKAIR